MSFLRSLFPILGFALLPLLTATLAVSEEPYETFRVGLEGTDLLQGSKLDPFWDFTPGFNLSLETPFYLGVGQAGLHQFNAQGINTPDLESRYTYLGWGYLLKPWERVEFVPAVRGGIWWQDYDDERNPVGAREENELAWELVGEARLRLHERWDLSLKARYRRVLTNESLEQGFVGIGVGYRFDSPPWLQGFLK